MAARAGTKRITMVAPKGVRAKAKVRAKKARAKRADAMIVVLRE